MMLFYLFVQDVTVLIVKTGFSVDCAKNDDSKIAMHTKAGLFACEFC